VSAPHWDWFAVFAVIVFVYYSSRLWSKLNDIERSLKALEEYLSEANSSLRSIDHNSGVVRDNTARP
jgi:hypothetical protein